MKGRTARQRANIYDATSRLGNEKGQAHLSEARLYGHQS